MSGDSPDAAAQAAAAMAMATTELEYRVELLNRCGAALALPPRRLIAPDPPTPTPAALRRPPAPQDGLQLLRQVRRQAVSAAPGAPQRIAFLPPT